jgi:hypothetical protein
VVVPLGCVRVVLLVSRCRVVVVSLCRVPLRSRRCVVMPHGGVVASLYVVCVVWWSSRCVAWGGVVVFWAFVVVVGRSCRRCVLGVCPIPQSPCHVCVRGMSDVPRGFCIQGISEGKMATGIWAHSRMGVCPIPQRPCHIYDMGAGPRSLTWVRGPLLASFGLMLR